MTALKVREVEGAIVARFADYLDLSNAGAASREQTIRSRGLAALAMQRVTGEDPTVCSAAVIDGFGDNGVDAVYADDSGSRIVVVQTKFRGESKRQGGIDLGDTRIYLAGVRDLLNERFDRFSTKLDAIAPQLSSLIHQEGTVVEMVLAYTTDDDLSRPVQQAVDDLLGAANDGDKDLLRLRVIKLEELHRFVLDSAGGAAVTLEATLLQWGRLERPYEAYYGTVTVDQVVGWYHRFGNRLFERNIRKALGMTRVNQRLVETLRKSAGHFWYLNNGITVLCDRVARAPVGGVERDRGRFTLEGVSVVNGAQTVMSIAESAQPVGHGNGVAHVWVRVISLAESADDFAAQITRATNTQNRVVESDFVALDSTQARLCRDFAITLRKAYIIKRGEEQTAPDDGCTLYEATSALACAHPDVRFTVLAQSSPARLWDTERGDDYRTLFRHDVQATEIWRWVQAYRQVEKAVAMATTAQSGAERAVANQGLRLIAHIAMSMADRSAITDPLVVWDDQLDLVAELAPRALALVQRHAASEFAGFPAPSLFRNIGRCNQLVSLVNDDLIERRVEAGRQRPEPAESRGPEVVTFYLSGRGAAARGRLHRNGVVVRSGSIAAREVTRSLDQSPSAANRRAWLIEQGILRPDFDRNVWVLTRDEYFDSASQAAAVMLGRPSNGRTEWRTAEGMSINQVVGGG